METKEIIHESVSSDWETLISFLPEGWANQAKESGALLRCREVKEAETLLRILLIHLAQGYSLKETSVRARQAGLANVSGVAVYKRLKVSGEWLRWMTEEMMKEAEVFPTKRVAGGLRVRLVDATVVNEPGATGSDWRVHYVLQLNPLRCDFFEITDAHGGESYNRVPVSKGDLIVGDRGYCGAKGVAHVVDHGGHVLVRVRMNGFSFQGEEGKKFKLLPQLKKLRVGQIGEWPVNVVGEEGKLIAGRICALRRSKAAAMMELENIRRENSKKGKITGRKAETGAHYICVFTTVDHSLLSAKDILELYRARWQVELAFKRLKSVFCLGHLPKHDPESAKAWLYGKLFVSILAEKIVEMAHSISPWGYVKIKEARQTTSSLC